MRASVTGVESRGCPTPAGDSRHTQAALVFDDKKRPSVAGVLSSTSMPCTGSTSVFVNPDYSSLKEFVRLGSRQLGSPV